MVVEGDGIVTVLSADTDTEGMSIVRNEISAVGLPVTVPRQTITLDRGHMVIATTAQRIGTDGKHVMRIADLDVNFVVQAMRLDQAARGARSAS